MDFKNISVGEKFVKKCGEVYLSFEGKFSFLCTCGEIYEGYQLYFEHHENHCSFHISKERFNNIEKECEDQGNAICETGGNDASGLPSVDFLTLIDDIKFEAPVPNNCVEMEEFIENWKNKNKSLPIRFQDMYLKPETGTDLSHFHSLNNSKIPISKSRRYRCPKCPFVSKSYPNVMMHISRHLGERRHFCEYCNKGFYTRNEVRMHTRIHTGERPYLCTQCGQTFVTNSALWRHTKSCRNIRDKACPKCDMKFFDNVGLRNHMTVHEEIRSHQCNICDASFKIAKVLKNHIKIHENKQEFKCRYCPASFNQKPGLLSHVKSKHVKETSYLISS